MPKKEARSLGRAGGRRREMMAGQSVVVVDHGREAFGEAYRKNFPSTVRLLISRGVAADAAEEFAQAAWAKGWERLPQLRDPSMTLPWVNSIAINLHRQGLRSKPLTEELNINLRGSASVDISAIIIRQAFRFCQESDRVLLQAYYLDGVEVETIAKQRGCHKTSIRVRLSRARRSFRKLLNTRPELCSPPA